MTAILEQLDEQGAFFNVEETPIFTGKGIEIIGKKAIVNTQTDKPISVVSSGYKTITNQEVFESFNESLLTSGIDIDGATAKVQFSHNRARTMVSVTVPSVRVNVAGDETHAQIIALNSYDGKWKYSVKAGGIRLACLNGQVIGTIVSAFSHVHTKNINIKSSADRMARMMNEFTHSKAWFENLISTRVHEITAQKAIARFVKGYVVEDPEILETVMNGRVARELYVIWVRYRAEMGANAFALYNTFTDYVTHKKYRANEATGILNGNKKIAEMIKPNTVFALPELARV